MKYILQENEIIIFDFDIQKKKKEKEMKYIYMGPFLFHTSKKMENCWNLFISIHKFELFLPIWIYWHLILKDKEQSIEDFKNEWMNFYFSFMPSPKCRLPCHYSNMIFWNFQTVQFMQQTTQLTFIGH